MTDIIERLRDRDAVVMSGLFHAIPTMAEAAEIIEQYRKDSERDERTNNALRKALQDILTANIDFRATMPNDWEGDLLQDACDAARMIMHGVVGTMSK